MLDVIDSNYNHGFSKSYSIAIEVMPNIVRLLH